MQNLQYNSPMKLYSTEAAEEQYQLHANQVPGQQNQPNIQLGHGHRQFDPTKSETLRAIQEEEYNNNQQGYNQQYNQGFNQQVYNNQGYTSQNNNQGYTPQNNNQQFVNKQFYNTSEQQRTPQNQGVQRNEWTGDVYERSERARSQTPNYQQKYYYGSDQFAGIPSSGPPQFTTDTPTNLVQIRYNSLPRAKKEDTHHQPVPSGASERGYLFGGMDFIDHAQDPEFFNVNDDYNDWYQRRSRKDEEYQKYKHNYGISYGSSPTRGYAYDENYRGYSANHPVKHWHYAADPCRPVNSYVSDVVECVDPVKLVGDTISNQKKPVEKFLTEEEKNSLGTPFTPPTGFLPDHRTVRPEPEEPGPICYSLSAKKHLARTDDYQYQGRSQSAGPHSNRPNYNSQSQDYNSQNQSYNSQSQGYNSQSQGHNSQSQNYGQQRGFDQTNNSQSYTQNYNTQSQNYGQPSENFDQTNNSQSYNPQQGYNSQSQSYGQSNNVQYNRTNVPVNAQQKPRKDVSLLTLVDDSAIQRREHKVNTDVPPERPFNNWSDAVDQKRSVWEGRTGQPAYTRTQNDRPAFWKKQPTSNQNGLQQQQNNQRQSNKYVQDTTDQSESQYNESYYQQQPQSQSNQQYYAEEQTKSNQIQQPQRAVNQNVQQSRPVQNQQHVNTVQRTTTTYQQSQPIPNSQQSYTYTQSGPVQQPNTQVLEYNTYTRHVNQSVPDFAGNRPQPPNQQFRVQGKQNVQPPQQNSQQVDHFNYYPQEQEPGDFHRPGFAKQVPPQRQTPQVKTPPAVPPKPQVNNQQVNNQQINSQQVKTSNQFSQPANNQNYSQYYYKETVQENNDPPRVVSYQKSGDFNRFPEMQEKLPSGKLGNTFSQSHREYQDPSGQNVEYSYELTTSTDPDYEAELLKEEERRVTEQELEPGVISRNVTTKYYKKKVVIDDQDFN